MQYLRLHKILGDVTEKETIGFGQVYFSGGESHIKLESKISRDVTIEVQLKSSDAVMELLIATDALRRAGAENISLLSPYIPYARQDRVMVIGEALSVKVFADLINSQGYVAVYTLNNHSPVVTALLNNCVEIDEERLLDYVIPFKDNVVLISPDAGAAKKTEAIAKIFKVPIVYASKIRDVETGKILKTHVDGRGVCGRHCVIIDDICDGGRTFVELALALKGRECGEITLYVSHGIFSKGVDELKKNISSIYTANCFKDLDESTRGISILTLRKEDLR